MEIDAPSFEVAAPRKFKLQLDDRGNAKVAIKVTILQGSTRIRSIKHVNSSEDPDDPPRNPTNANLDLAAGAYKCRCSITASREEALGPTYRSTVTLIDDAGVETLLFKARGTLPESTPRDLDAEQIDLTVS
jgi:hypothetical protein